MDDFVAQRSNWRILALVGLSFGLVGCQNAQQMPKGTIVLNANEIPALLSQCSRSAPAQGEGSWTPDVTDILKLETKLPSTLKEAQPEKDWTAFPTKWQRQFVGIIRGGRHYVYGSYAPVSIDWPLMEKAMGVCDGGPDFFGAEYEKETGKITHIDFNGSI